MLRNYLLLFSFISFACLAHAYKWHRGLYQIDQMESGIQFAKFGELSTGLPTEKFPLEFAQLANFSASDSAKLFFRLSTRVSGKWEGPGTFSIEAFDHSWVPLVSSQSVDEYTRTIFYCDKGLLFINAEALTKESFILIETPLGRVMSYGGIFSLKLEEFKDSGQRNAIINCYEGSLVYTDQKGVAHSLSSGNKMPIILKEDLFKVNRLELDELEQRAVSNYNKERVNFIEADAFPEVENATQVDSGQKAEANNEGEAIKQSYYFPVVEQMKSFNPYKKSYSDD
jgi:hypothetical protein